METRHAFREALHRGDAATVRQMLAAEPALAQEGSVLTKAVKADALEVLRALLEAGAEDGRGSPALMAAAAAGREELVALLLEHGADATARDAEGLSTADHAQRNGHAELATRLMPTVRGDRVIW